MGSIQERANILDRAGNEILARKDELGRLLSREEGKTLPEGVGEAMRAGYIFKFFAGEVLRLAGEKLPSVRPGVDVEITREPLGVVGLITPWNFPVAIPAGDADCPGKHNMDTRIDLSGLRHPLTVGEAPRLAEAAHSGDLLGRKQRKGLRAPRLERRRNPRAHPMYFFTVSASRACACDGSPPNSRSARR